MKKKNKLSYKKEVMGYDISYYKSNHDKACHAFKKTIDALESDDISIINPNIQANLSRKYLNEAIYYYDLEYWEEAYFHLNQLFHTKELHPFLKQARESCLKLDYNEDLAVYGYVNIRGKTCIEHQYKYAREFHEDLAVVFINGAGFRYIDRYGQEVMKPYKVDGKLIPLRFDAVTDFEHNIALVLWEYRFWFINRNGVKLTELFVGEKRKFEIELLRLRNLREEQKILSRQMKHEDVGTYRDWEGEQQLKIQKMVNAVDWLKYT